MGLHLPPGGFEVLLVAMNLKMFAGLGLCGLIASGTMAQTAAPAVTNLWKVRLPDSGNESSPALAPDGTIYQGTFDGWLAAVTPDGKMKWKFKTGREVRSSPAVADDGTIYFGSRDWKFYALTPAGKLKWRFPTGAWVDSSPAVAPDGTVYFGSWDKIFYALAPDGKLKWKFATSNLIISSPALALDGTVYFGSHDKNFYALTPDGKLKWKFATGAELESSPAIGADGTVYFSSTDGNLYALRPDGTELWRLHTGGCTGSSPALDEDGNLYLAASSSFVSISRAGKLRWRSGLPLPLDTSPAAAANGQVYFSSPWLYLGAFGTNGAYLWEFRAGYNFSSSPNVNPQGIIYANDGRYLFALQPLTNAAPLVKSSWPMWRADLQHSGRVQKLN
jgi:outer membrane protein assembly factor BamB